MRTFIGFELSENLKREIVKVHETIENTGAFVRWVKPENIHITAKFLGQINDEYIPKIEDMIFDVAKRAVSFEITLGDLGAFPTSAIPRIIWAGVSKNKDKLEKLTQRIIQGCVNLGFPKDDEKQFLSHVTIGRVNYPKDKRALSQVLKEFKLKKEPCLIDSIKLFSSELTSDGPIYKKTYEAFLKKKNIQN